MFLREFRFKSPPAVPIARQRNFALDGYTAPREFFVVVGHSIVHVDHLSGHVTVGPVDVIGW
jgi:hypothetical protein